MSIKNFKISTGLDLEGLILTTADSELLVDGSPLATQSYVDTEIGNIAFDGSQAAGEFLDWDAQALQFNVNIPSGTYALPSDIPSLTGYATETYVTTQGYLVSSDLSGYALTTDIPSLTGYVNAVNNAFAEINGNTLDIRVGSGLTTYDAGQGYIQLVVDTDTIATQNYVGQQGYLVSSDLSGYALTTDIPSLTGYATETYVTTQGYLVSSDLSGYALTTDIPSLTGYVTETGTQDLSNKTIIDTLYFSDSVTIAQEGEIAVKATTHEFEIKANYGDVTLKTVAAPEGVGSNVNISSLYGDIVLDTPAQGKHAYIGSVAAGNEIATKSYVDGVATGLDVKASVKYATATSLAGTFTSDEVGSPKTFTATANEILLVDGQQVSLGDRVLVKNESSVVNNGIYEVTVVGDDGTRGGSAAPAVLVRTSDGIPYDSLTTGAFTFVEFGNTNAGKGFVATVASATDISWTQFSETGNYITSVTANQALSVTSGELTLTLAGSTLEQSSTGLAVSTTNVASAIAGTGITYDQATGTLQAAPAYIESVDASFAVTNGELSLSDTISIASVELTDSVASVTAASDVFGNASTSTYAMGSAVTVGTLPTGADVADVFITLKAPMGAFTHSRTSKLTYVNTGGDAPTWTEYGIINSGAFPATTISFDSSGNILANVTGSDTYSVKGVVTILK